MFPKKAVASVIGIGGMFGGFGGIIVNKSGGWLFDSYRLAGIANSWVQAKTAGLGGYLDQVLGLKLVNSHGAIVDLNKTALSSLPKDVVAQLQSLNPDSFAALKQLQVPLIQGQMTTAYSIMFGICAVAYIIAWIVMKALVPKFKKVVL